ncbi:MAG TPA: GNAT family N-acetyltransferase [Candidatus Limnocylindrales bacterium]|jgi:ribosomal protein S18 acetylase RimI-like enzyme
MLQAPTIPGLRLRPYAGAPDLAELARIGNAEAEADLIDRRATEAEIGVEYGFPNEHFDAARDVTVAEVDGRVVAFASREWIDTTDGLREYRLDGSVDPAFRGRGIGATLLAHGERRMRELAASHDTTLPRVFGSWCADTQERAIRLLASAGFEPARWFFDMTRPTLDDVPNVPLPDGLDVRPITRDLALQVWRADVEAFRDHWGGFDGSDDRLESWLARPNMDLSMWVIAFDGNEVAGGVLNMIDPDENAALGIRRGWLSSVFTRRQWRRRGVARALIARSLALHRERGMTSASLGVDADNPSGALGLYEGTGFKVDYRSTAWRKPF